MKTRAGFELAVLGLAMVISILFSLVILTWVPVGPFLAKAAISFAVALAVGWWAGRYLAAHR